jgi:hypothetical protein
MPTGYATIDRILGTQPPDYLYHYTSPAGLIGIAEKKVIWATHYRFLNDRLELKHAESLLREHLLDLRGQTTGTNITVAVIEGALARLDPLLQEQTPEDIFVVSLTKHKNQLSQWRAYCPPGGGYSIGFPTKLIQDLAKNQKYLLARCSYSHQECQDFCREVCDVCLEYAKSNDEQWFADIAAYILVNNFKQYGPIFKHESFGEEAEWRLIYRTVLEPSRKPIPHAPPELENEGLHFRSGNKSVIPYREFSIPDADKLVNYDPLRVVVGPTPDQAASMVAIRRLAAKWSPDVEIEIARAETPYRGS